MRTTEDRASTSWSDEHLVTAALSGDVEAFAAIYDRYADSLFNACYRQLGNREEAADVVQDTFVLAKEELPRLRDARRLRSWLFTIATRQALWVIRSRARSSPTDEFGDIVEDGAGPEEQAERSEIAVLLRAAGEGLSPTERSVLGLYLSGLTNAEIAQAVGLRLQAVHVCLHRLRGQVESSLGALLILRRGHRDCDGLAAAVGSWDGQFSPLVRKRVARHVRDCETCGSRQARLLTREALLGLIPWLAVPDEVRSRVLDHVRPALATGAPAAVGPAPVPAPLLGRIWTAPAAPPPPPSGAGLLVKVGGAAAVITLLLGIGAMRAIQRPEPETATPQAATQIPPAPALAPVPVVPPASGSAPASGSGTVADPAARAAAPVRPRASAPVTASAPKDRSTTGRITAPAPVVSEPATPAGTAPVDPAGLRNGRIVPAVAPEQVPAIAAVAPQPGGGVGVSIVPAGAPAPTGTAAPAEVPAPAAQPQAAPPAQPQTASAEPEQAEPSGQPAQSAEPQTQSVPLPATAGDTGTSTEPPPEQAVTQPPPAPQPQPQPAQQQPAPAAQPTPPQVGPGEPGKEGEGLDPDAEAARRAEEAALLTTVAEQEGITGEMQEDGTFLADNGLRLEVVDGQIRSRPADEGADTGPEIREDGSWVNENGDIMELGPTGEPRVRTPAEDTANGLGATTADGEQQSDCPETGCEPGQEAVTGAADTIGQGVGSGVNGEDTGTTDGEATRAGDEGQTVDPEQVTGDTTLDPGATGDDWWQDINDQSSQNGTTPPSADDPANGVLGGSFPVEPASGEVLVTQRSGPQ